MSDKTTRIELIQAEDAPKDILPLYERADSAMKEGVIPSPTLFGNQVRALAHNPRLLRALLDVYTAFSETQSVDRKLIELGILVVSRVNACDYCLRHHTPLAHEFGLTKQQLQCLNDGSWDKQPTLWSAEELLIIQYAEKMTREPYKISDEFSAELRTYFDDRQIVDMTMRFALCSAWNKFNDALSLDTETAFQHTFAELMSE
jgi:uncharacterized peroxidase-related enzyme